MKCLLCVDLQNDFCPNGALPVPDGDKIIPIINELLPKFDLVIFTMDWHPKNNVGFYNENDKQKNSDKNIQLWPVHCVENTYGASLRSDIDFSKCKDKFLFFKKGKSVFEHTFSAFADFEYNKDKYPELVKILDSYNVDELFVCGLAEDYCVKETAIDAASKYGYDTTVIINACKAITDDNRHVLTEFLLNDIKICNTTDPDLFNII